MIERARTLADEAARAASPDEFAEIVVDRLWHLIPCDGVVFNEIDQKTRRLLILRSKSVRLPDGSDGTLWADHDDEPAYCLGFGPGESGVARMSDVFDRFALGRSPIYREILWPAAFRYSVEMVFASPPSLRQAVILARADRDFTARECDLLALLRPHLQDACRRARVSALLTRREREVLSLVADGLTNREIGRRLGISPGTVRIHLEHAFPKLGVRSRTAAISLVR